MSARILVLGIGNVLLRDEGVGVRVIERLRARHRLAAHVQVLDGGTSGMCLLDDVSACTRLLIVDCARLDAAPGSVREFVGDAVPAFFQQRISPHQIGLSDLLAAAALLDALPSELALVAIQPEAVGLGIELSQTCGRAVETALACVLARLADWGGLPAPTLAEVA